MARAKPKLSALQRTALYDLHLERGARMAPFAGFEMPIQYTSIKREHNAVRETAGLFDVSHMGQIHFAGPRAVATLERLLSCPVATLAPGRVRYGLLCNEAGGVVDDVTVYRVEEERWFLCVNAANIEKDWRWCARHSEAGVELLDRSAQTALLALQGPGAEAALAKHLEAELDDLQRFRFISTRFKGLELLVSRTGYTGADGFELYCAPDAAAPLWRALEAEGALPCGLGARDTLRIEAALPLYGQELDEQRTPLEAGLERFVKLEAGGFIGVDALREQAARGPAQRLAGFELRTRGVARAGYAIARDGQALGVVSSGAPSPTLGKSIGLGYVPPALTAPGAHFDVLVRGRPLGARVVRTPFVRSPARRASRNRRGRV